MNAALNDPRLRMLNFRAWRRGFREADLILGPFADAHLRDLDAGQLDRLEVLLEVPDADLYGWIVETHSAPAEFDHDVLQLIRAFRHSMTVAPTVRGG